MFTNIIKSDRNREQLELSNRGCSTYFWGISDGFLPSAESSSSIFCSWCQKTSKFYLNLNHGRKIWDKVLASAWHVAEPWIFHPDFLSHGDIDLWNLGCDTWRTFEYLKSGTCHGMRPHEYFIFECHNEWFAEDASLSKIKAQKESTMQWLF